MFKMIITTFILVCIYLVIPAKNLYEINRFIEFKLAGVHESRMQVDDHNISFYHGGDSKDIVLLLHGFGGSKENWNKLSAELSKNHQVYAIDLPGFGKSHPFRGENNIVAYRDLVIRFIEQIGTKKIKIIGHSTGGLIAAHVARKIPNIVEKVWLISPLGAEGGYESDMTNSLREGKNILVPKSQKDFEFLLNKLFYTKPFIPSKVLKYIADRSIQDADNLTSIFRSTHQFSNDKINVRPSLNQTLMDYPHDIYLSWGKEDKLLNYKGGIFIKEQIPKVHLNLEDEVGHMYLIEHPKVPGGF